MSDPTPYDAGNPVADFRYRIERCRRTQEQRDALAAACVEVAEWLGRRSLHYQELGSHDVAADLLDRAERLRSALALTEKGTNP